MKHKQVIAISGVSGAGKSTMARVLEDNGFFVVDNLPSQLLDKVISLVSKQNDATQQLAFVIDAREQHFLAKFPSTWKRLRSLGHSPRLLFLDCSDETIIRRFKETRRRHPLERGEGMRDSIARERALLKDIKAMSDEIIVTNDLNVHELKHLIQSRFVGFADQELVVTLLSFGFKYGLPPELDLCFDARFLKNPYFIENLRPLSGLDAPVRRFVLSVRHAKGFLSRVRNLLEYLVPLHKKEGKIYMTVGIGCTGGRHRSPALITELRDRLLIKQARIRIEHRDIEK